MKTNEKALAVLQDIKIGWNLGNYLEVTDRNFQIGKFLIKSVEEVVKLWHNPIFNLKCVDTLNAYGFNCIRIPVTWCNFVENANCKISEELITYLKKILDYATSKKFYVILDMHHDDHNWLTVAGKNKEFKKVKQFYIKIWESIAEEFKDYNEFLIFEGMNEIIDRTNPKSFDWWGKNKIFFKRLKMLYSCFVKCVRKYSLQNRNRTLMISTYGAQIHKKAIKNLKMPKYKNVIVDLHFYSKYEEKDKLKQEFSEVFNLLQDKKVPIILGEIGVKKDYVNNFKILKTYLDFANEYNLKVILWDNGSSRKFLNRESAEFSNKDLAEYLK